MTFAVLAATLMHATGAWARDFALQPVADRPALEVRYTDGTRTAFEVVAEKYSLVGELQPPHRLVDNDSGALWLSLGVTGAEGTVYATAYAGPASRINLYRRGPYFCEVHWLDVQVATEDGTLAPLKGDLALYCYPDKLLASITWHATEAFPASVLRIEGIAPVTRDLPDLAEGAQHTEAFPLFGETGPLPESVFENIEAVAPMEYDAVRGCYTIGSLSTGGFEGHFYHHPNRYEQVCFRVTNDGQPRTIYICHENTGGDLGSVEGGVLLDEEGHPLPVVVQISKNFAGEKEEKFYNPHDTPFSETYFPLHLDANETRTLTSFHLYQNWGRHMVKQFSSLGAWMDYFHSSTGVTETTCYVPLKFAGLPGVAIADFRAMSQTSFWGGQPQHDNVAGHSFLSYRTDEGWQYLVYRGTTYRSTGPNWMDIGLEYLSTDGCVRVTVETFELPQRGELRNFIRVHCEVLKPLTVVNAREDLRLLTVASWVQRLRYTHFAATGHEVQPLTFDTNHFGVCGAALPAENAFVAMYGEPKGSNAIVLRNWDASIGGKSVGPATSVWCEESGDTRMLLVPDAGELTLAPGDTFTFDAFWLPYGDPNSAATPEAETQAYGTNAPRLVNVAKGRAVSDFPTVVHAKRNRAEFTAAGGRDLIPVIVTGLTDYRWPRIYRKEERDWRLLHRGRVGDLDGVQVFSEGKKRFGAVFLVYVEEGRQDLRVTVGQPPPLSPRLTVTPAPNPAGCWHHAAAIQAPWMDAPVRLRFPETLHTDTLDFIDHQRDDMPARVDPAPLAEVWEESEGGSVWFEWQYDNQRAGGRLSPNEDDVDLEFWLSNGRREPVHVSTQFCPVLAGTMFEDRTLERTWLYAGGAWKKMSDTDRGAGERALCHYPVTGAPDLQVPLPWGTGGDTADIGVAAVTSPDGRYVFAIAWPNARSILSNADIPCVHADPMWPACPSGRRVYLRGKVYLMEGTLNDLIRRVRREIGPLQKR